MRLSIGQSGHHNVPQQPVIRHSSLVFGDSDLI
jgi:hypothetical protein